MIESTPEVCALSLSTPFDPLSALMNLPRKDHGFTLLELMAALAVF
ncbi:MAG: type II secretion system protein, partial [Magnetococcales bacterium]|nr:type II secretion system protein [Magnetococcales bacterium]